MMIKSVGYSNIQQVKLAPLLVKVVCDVMIVYNVHADQIYVHVADNSCYER